MDKSYGAPRITKDGVFTSGEAALNYLKKSMSHLRYLKISFGNLSQQRLSIILYQKILKILWL